MDSQDAKRKRPVTCLESGATYDSAYRAAKELGFADSRNIFRSIQRGTCTQGLHFYYADEPKPAPEFFIPPNRPPRPVVCLDTGEMFESRSRRAARSTSLPEACAHRQARASSAAGCTSITATSRNPRLNSSGSAIRKPAPSSAWRPASPSWATRPRPPSACIAHRDQPGRPLRIARKRAPFLPWRRAETCAGVLQAGEGQRRQEPCGDSCRGEGSRGE